MAYRKAEQERWKSFDFVVGYEVKITQNGKHVEDICDCLKGKYRKDFKFMGWHPQCMCYTIPILKTEDEFFDEDEDAKSVNEVEDVPQGFKDWVKDNEERIDKAAERGKLPYFIADNHDTVKGILEDDKERKSTPVITQGQEKNRKYQNEEVEVPKFEKRENTKDEQARNERQNSENLSSSDVQNVKTPLTDAQKQRRAEIRQVARETITDNPILIPGINKEATISSGKIKEWLNQPHKHILEKNEALLNLPELIKNGKYEGCGVDEHDPTAIAHLVKVVIAGEDSWVVIRELNDGKIGIHSISDNPSIVDKIIKKKP